MATTSDSVYNQKCDRDHSANVDWKCPSIGSQASIKSGLSFSVSCTNYPYSDILPAPIILGTVGQCMEMCMTIQYGAIPCLAFVFNSNCECYLKLGTASTGDYYPDDSVIGGLVVADDIKYPESSRVCPYPNLSIQNASNGAPYTVFCGTSFGASKYGPQYISAAPDYTQVVIQPLQAVAFDELAWHAESWEECLEMCATAHPACWQFTFNLGYSWINCFLQNDTLTYPGGMANYAVSSGQLAPPPLPLDPGWKCLNGSEKTVNGVNFTLSCNDFRLPTTGKIGIIDQKHFSSIDDCIAACVSMTTPPDENNDDGLPCIAVMFDDQLQFGWDNCYFKNDLGPGKAEKNYTLAFMTSETTRYTVPVGSIPSSSSKKLVAITVPTTILGSLLVVGLIYLLFKKLGYRLWPLRQYRGFHKLNVDHSDLPTTTTTAAAGEGGVVRRATAYEGASMELQALHARY